MQTTIELEQLGEFAATSHIERALEAVDGVSSVSIDEGRATVEHHGADLNELLEALRILGYDRAQIAQTT
jgi:copper chaperone CopZ